VVASNVWGNPEVVRSPAAGRLMKERSATGVAQAVRALFSSGLDREATRRYAEGFSWDETSRGQIALFRGILGRAEVDAEQPAASALNVRSDPVAERHRRHAVLEMIGQPDTESHDGEGRPRDPSRRQYRTAADEQVFHPVDAAVPINDAG